MELEIDNLEYFLRGGQERCIGTLSLKHASMTTNVGLSFGKDFETVRQSKNDMG